MNTIASETRWESLVKKSRFIACALRSDSEAEFHQKLDALRQEFPRATHYVYAYVIREGSGQLRVRCSDDGEPKGTAGKPVLAPLQGRDLVNAAVVVIRYFGGIKLGAGGLVRAYGGAATAVLEQVGSIRLSQRVPGRLTVSYPDQKDAEHRLKSTGAVITGREFGTKVTILYEIEVELP